MMALCASPLLLPVEMDYKRMFPRDFLGAELRLATGCSLGPLPCLSFLKDGNNVGLFLVIRGLPL